MLTVFARLTKLVRRGSRASLGMPPRASGALAFVWRGS